MVFFIFLITLVKVFLFRQKGVLFHEILYLESFGLNRTECFFLSFLIFKQASVTWTC